MRHQSLDEISRDQEDMEMRTRHPSSNPNFDAKREHEIWYLAHPLAPDDRFTFQQNMDHVVKLMRICYEEGWYVIAPYHTICLALDDDNEEWRRIGLEVDCNVVKKFGRILLTGHRCSSGMCHERDTCLDFQYGGLVYNFVGYNDVEFRHALRALKNGGFLERDEAIRKEV